MLFRYLFIFLFSLMQCEMIAQPYSSTYFDALQWRCIGPHRGGRTVGAIGIPSQPNVFYIGVNNGGVWKTTDYGRTWLPIFDDLATGSIGDIAISAAQSNTIYVGSGEGLQRPDLSVGDGIYKSTDGGQHWKNTGLGDAQQIGGLSIDPHNENRIFVAALGHPYAANRERGVYRSTNGGESWENVLFIDENTGAVQVLIDPINPNIVYADLWAGRLAPWENGQWNGKNGGLFKSTDGGNSWNKLNHGLPGVEQGLGRIGFCIAPSDNKRLYACVDATMDGGIYRSDDAGESWTLINADKRLWSRGTDFAEIKVDPKNADIVYSANVVVWKSIDGGKNWNAFRGAPGGDDYHRIWINPNNSNIILIASDQGAIITVNGGETFSSWYNQPTAQLYHVSADNDFPYNVYSGQQESGSVGIASRGNEGQITFRDWKPVAAEEYGYVVADPKDPNIIYGGKISRFDKRTGQSQNISPDVLKKGNYRFIRTAPIIFNPIDHTTLYYAGNVLFQTKNRGKSWKIISPDLSREQWEVPKCVGIYNDSADKYTEKNMPRRGVIYSIAPSYVDKKTIWCGTDDGLIHITHDAGKKWTNVSPQNLTSWYKVSLMEASHSDVNTAYAAINGIRTDDQRPHIYKTKDGGKSWKEIVKGLPNQPINVVKEDPIRRGLLFAGSETNVFVSFDDGEHWQSLRLNMPASSIRDLCIKDDDLIVATHGRSFWILDNISSLRQIASPLLQQKSILFRPKNNYRLRWNMNTDTPLPPEEPAGQNPPDGAMIDYYLDQDVKQIRLDIVDNKGLLVSSFSNQDSMYQIPEVNIPLYWIRPQQILSNLKGSHRFLWDMHYPPLKILPTYPISAIYRNTAPEESSPWVIPGNYTARLTIDGKIQEEHFSILKDPRLKVGRHELEAQHSWSMSCYKHLIQCRNIIDDPKTNNRIKNEVNTYFVKFLSDLRMINACDQAPTNQMIDAIQQSILDFDKMIKLP